MTGRGEKRGGGRRDSLCAGIVLELYCLGWKIVAQLESLCRLCRIVDFFDTHKIRLNQVVYGDFIYWVNNKNGKG